MELLTIEQSRKIDALAKEAGISEAQLIKNAGKRAAQIIQRLYPQCRVHILVGGGNNGADGLVVAETLKAQGYDCRVFMLNENPYRHFWRGKVYDFTSDHSKAAIVVDALFGTGLARPLAAELLALANSLTQDIISLDMPSGFNGDDGSGAGFCAAHTISFVRAHPAHYLLPAKEHCGEIHIADIGLEPFVVPLKSNISLNEGRTLPPLPPAVHKYQRGAVLVMAGDFTKRGAATLAARAAMRIGAGLVTINEIELVHQNEISIMSESLPLEESLKDERRNVIVLGCGNGVNERTKNNVLLALSKNIDCVLDADALTCFSGDRETLFAAIKNKTTSGTASSGAVVLTPHEGEFTRLFQIEDSKLEQARQAAKLSGAVIVLKGNDTIIASPLGEVIINSSAPPYLAKAGTGDVLAGLIGGVLAQKTLSPMAAVAYAVFTHGQLGQAAGENLIATDLPDLIPAILSTSN